MRSIGTADGNRTRMPYPAGDFKSPVSAKFPPQRHFFLVSAAGFEPAMFIHPYPSENSYAVFITWNMSEISRLSSCRIGHYRNVDIYTKSIEFLCIDCEWQSRTLPLRTLT